MLKLLRIALDINSFPSIGVLCRPVGQWVVVFGEVYLDFFYLRCQSLSIVQELKWGR